MALRSLTSRISQKVWSTVHLCVGGRGQVRVNKGFKPQDLNSLGSALFFARYVRYPLNQSRSRSLSCLLLYLYILGLNMDAICLLVWFVSS